MAAPAISGKMAQACGTNGTVRHTAAHAGQAAAAPPTSTAMSNTAIAASAPSRPIVSTAPSEPARAKAGASSTGSPGA